MVGRTPELLGKKIEAKEMKIASIIALLHTLLILSFTALSSYMYAHDPTTYAGWLNNPGNHGFSEMLYEYTSSSANNGSGFEGLGDGVPFWNITCGIVMLISRYLPIIGPGCHCRHTCKEKIHTRKCRAHLKQIHQHSAL
jgi:K+-transporting ATPase ATPase A chain